MSPQNPENDPVHKGLHDLGRQIEESESATSGAEGGDESPALGDPEGRSDAPTPTGASGSDPGTDDEMPWPAPPPAETPAPASPAAPEAEGSSTPAVLPADPADNPVERGLHELGRQIDEAERGGDEGGDEADEGQGDRHTPRRRRSARPAGRWPTSSALFSWCSC
jgi:hypothetical protein